MTEKIILAETIRAELLDEYCLKNVEVNSLYFKNDLLYCSYNGLEEMVTAVFYGNEDLNTTIPKNIEIFKLLLEEWKEDPYICFRDLLELNVYRYEPDRTESKEPYKSKYWVGAEIKGHKTQIELFPTECYVDRSGIYIADRRVIRLFFGEKEYDATEFKFVKKFNEICAIALLKNNERYRASGKPAIEYLEEWDDREEFEEYPISKKEFFELLIKCFN